MESQFYKNVPNWMSETLDGKKCSKCKHNLGKHDILGIGIKQIEGKCTTFVEFKCPGCGYEARYSFENIVQNSIEKMCYMILEQVQKRKKMQKSVSLKSSKANSNPISDKEVQDFLKELNEIKTHEDFLKIISASQYIEPDTKNET